MLRFFVSACLLAGLTGCAAAPVSAVPATHAVATSERPDQGVIVAQRHVPSDHAQPIRRLLDRLGAPPAASDATEFIVQVDDGATLAIVSPAQPELKVGERVSVLRGQPARLVAAGHVVAAR